ncbi:hypothetical protein CVT25_005589 [Psilocybe cyanescens]|uniref:DUF1996 domain-containing protein n=1 Tax=Psilocybe cyanescens TaxID=93625 RepID=A0A409VUF2_PSICY|nr:hypothetical protein CVT25_005589 [Psilocybe cyanescens]
MKFTILPALIAVAFDSLPVNAWFRVPCTTPLVQGTDLTSYYASYVKAYLFNTIHDSLERIDPIISPGMIPSNHVHTVHGANGFASNSTYDTLRLSTCSSCLVAQDMSNYWFAKLYFRDPKTKKFEPVPDGGLLVYYENRGDGDVSNGGAGLKAFPPGFIMISGDPTRRSRKYSTGQGSQAELAERAVEWECLRYTSSTAGYSSVDNGPGFPNTDCESGLNARIHMPACWDGVNLDSPDHVSHTAFLSGLDNGACPSTHPVPLMKLLDPTGFSWHADFQNGWDTEALQNAIDKCNNPNDPTGTGITEACSFLTVQSNATLAGECKITPQVNETIDGVLDRLPGCNPLQDGPQDAILQTDAKCSDMTSAAYRRLRFRIFRDILVGLALPLVWAMLLAL